MPDRSCPRRKRTRLPKHARRRLFAAGCAARNAVVGPVPRHPPVPPELNALEAALWRTGWRWCGRGNR
jgi:hypothetical protein